MPLMKKALDLPPLPADLESALTVSNTQPWNVGDHAKIHAHLEVPSGRGPGARPDTLSLRVFGQPHGWLLVRGLWSTPPGAPASTPTSMQCALPIDLVRPFCLALERAAALAVVHEREATRHLVAAGAEPEASLKGWTWF